MAASSQAPVVSPALSRSEGKGIESTERTDDDFVIDLERCARGLARSSSTLDSFNHYIRKYPHIRTGLHLRRPPRRFQ
jgi:hypothetical protein